jgi:hypothetical protein
VEIEHEVAIALAGDATDLVLGDTAQTLQGLGVPPLRDLLAKLKDHEVPVYV